MDAKPKEHLCDRILIVEGYSDLHFCAAFLQHLGKLEGTFIKEFRGRSNILKFDTLQTYLSPKLFADKKSIGILMDADLNAAGAIQSLKESLKRITGREVKEGEWNDESPGNARLGLFVAPDGTSHGELETLVWYVWSSNAKNADGKESVEIESDTSYHAQLVAFEKLKVPRSKRHMVMVYVVPVEKDGGPVVHVEDF